MYIRVAPRSLRSPEPVDAPDLGSESCEKLTSMTGGVATFELRRLDPPLLVRNISLACSWRVCSIDDSPPSSRGLEKSGGVYNSLRELKESGVIGVTGGPLDCEPECVGVTDLAMGEILLRSGVGKTGGS